MSEVDPWLTGPEVASVLGIKPVSWRTAVAKGYAPPADDPGVGPVNRRNPRWRLSSVRRYELSRPGRGARTDLRKAAS
jgi:hypothetical protein